MCAVLRMGWADWAQVTAAWLHKLHMTGRGKRALRLTRDHKPSVAGESERIRGAGGEVNQQCALQTCPGGPACLCNDSVQVVGGAAKPLIIWWTGHTRCWRGQAHYQSAPPLQCFNSVHPAFHCESSLLKARTNVL